MNGSAASYWLSAMVRASLGATLIVSSGCAGGQEPSTPEQPNPETLLADEAGEQPQAAPASSAEVEQAMEAIKSEDFQEAVNILEPLAGGSKDPQVFYYLGVAQANVGEVEPAIVNLKKALELDPKLVEASLNLAALLLDLGRPKEALQVLESGLRNAPNDVALLQNKALALLMAGDVAAATGVYAKVVERKPDDQELRFTYAQALAESGKRDEAAEQLGKLKTSQNIAVLNSSADLLGRLGKFDACIAFAERAISIDAQSELYLRRGLCKGGKKDHEGALADFKKAVELDDQFAAAHFYLGKALQKKDKQAARAAFETTIALSKENPKLEAAAQRALSEL